MCLSSSRRSKMTLNECVFSGLTCKAILRNNLLSPISFVSYSPFHSFLYMARSAENMAAKVVIFGLILVVGTMAADALVLSGSHQPISGSPWVPAGGDREPGGASDGTAGPEVGRGDSAIGQQPPAQSGQTGDDTSTANAPLKIGLIVGVIVLSFAIAAAALCCLLRSDRCTLKSCCQRCCCCCCTSNPSSLRRLPKRRPTAYRPTLTPPAKSARAQHSAHNALPVPVPVPHSVHIPGAAVESPADSPC